MCGGPRTECVGGPRIRHHIPLLNTSFYGYCTLFDLRNIPIYQSTPLPTVSLTIYPYPHLPVPPFTRTHGMWMFYFILFALTDHLRESFPTIRNTAPFNATGHPALSINVGYDDDKLPVGMMIVGKHYDDETVLRVASAVEQLALSVCDS